MAERVRITDVSPRDGLQNEPGVIATADKVRLVELLCASGVDEVEVTSFVSPRWVPQLGDAAEVLRGAARIPRVRGFGNGRVRDDGWWLPEFSALVPNVKGVQAASEFGASDDSGVLRTVSVFIAASETFSQRNINCSVAESIARVREVIGAARDRFGSVRGYVSCVIACPFEGPMAPHRVAKVVGDLFECGVDDIDLGDTIGAGTPESVVAMLRAACDELNTRVDPAVRNKDPLAWLSMLTLHLHDTFGRAAECVRAALDLGVRSFDGAVAGLGGCPYASMPGKRAPGNISTELLVKTVQAAGYETGVDLGKLAEAGAFARSIVEKARAEAAEKGGAMSGGVTA